MRTDRLFPWTLGLLGASFVLSLALYLLVPGSLTRTVLRFPHEIQKTLVPEARSLPFGWDREHNVELLVKEVLLGPARHDHLRLFSRWSSLEQVMVRDDEVYIDLSKSSLIPDPDVLYSPVMAVEILENIVKANFPGISIVWVSVGGEPARDLSLTKDKASI